MEINVNFVRQQLTEEGLVALCQSTSDGKWYIAINGVVSNGPATDRGSAESTYNFKIAATVANEIKSRGGNPWGCCCCGSVFDMDQSQTDPCLDWCNAGYAAGNIISL